MYPLHRRPDGPRRKDPADLARNRRALGGTKRTLRPATVADLEHPERLLARLERTWSSARSDPFYEREVARPSARVRDGGD
jgi:hypothetical protein